MDGAFNRRLWAQCGPLQHFGLLLHHYLVVAAMLSAGETNRHL